MRGAADNRAYKRPSRGQARAMAAAKPCPLCGLSGPLGGHPQCVARDQARALSLSDRHRRPEPVTIPGPARTRGPAPETQEPRTNRSTP